MKKTLLLLLAVCFFANKLNCQPATFNYTGAVQTYTVGACVYSMTVDMKAGAGAASPGSSIGGNGGRVQATIPVTPGEVLNIYVGGAAIAASGGWNGGGLGGSNAGGGGGASDIRQGGTSLSNRTIVAGGGSGGGFNTSNNCAGGHGGGLIGADGWYGGVQGHMWAGKGGTQSAGGLGGNNGSLSGSPGTLGTGGNGPNPCGGGGGGGYYGGGSGATLANAGGGGGGGSSYTISVATGITHTQGFQTGDGQIIITPIVTPLPPAPGTVSGSSSLCSGTVASYSISAVSGATSYTWTVPAGSTITSGQGTTTVSVTFGTTSGNVSVSATNACGTGPASNNPVTVNNSPGLSACTAAPMCPQINPYTGNVRGYYFTAPANFIICGVYVPTDASSDPQSVEVVRFTAGPPPAYPGTTNSFNSLFYQANYVPNTMIACNLQVNAGEIIGVYGARGTVNSYAQPQCVTTIEGNSVTLFRSGMQFTINNQQMHDIWSEDASSINRIVLYTQSGPSNINGPTTLCANSAGSYSINAAPGATSYNWAVPSGASITSGSGTNTVSVTFGNSSGYVSVSAVNNCGSSPPDSVAVMVDSCAVGISSVNENKTIRITPNPTTGKIYLSLSSLPAGQAGSPGGDIPIAIRKYDVEIFNVMGEKVFTSPLAPLSRGRGVGGEVDLSSHPVGIYLVKIVSENESVMYKIIKQ